MTVLYYIHDPMCSWCYAFKPLYQELLKQLPARVETLSLLGGLAADTDQPMPLAMQQQLKATWQRIEQKVPGTVFNYDFWNQAEQTKPRRATYPACRAVIAARAIDPAREDAMLTGIQKAYYQQAKNPSETKTLVEIAQAIGLNPQTFELQLNSPATQQELEQQIQRSRQLKVSSYPSLILQTSARSYWPVSIDYLNVQNILQDIHAILDFDS